MRISVLFIISAVLMIFSVSAHSAPAGIGQYAPSQIHKVAARFNCGRGYDACTFNAYDRRGICRSMARRNPRLSHARCQRQFEAAMASCKRRFCRLYPFERQIRPELDRDDLFRRRNRLDR